MSLPHHRVLLVPFPTCRSRTVAGDRHRVRLLVPAMLLAACGGGGGATTLAVADPRIAELVGSVDPLAPPVPTDVRALLSRVESNGFDVARYRREVRIGADLHPVFAPHPDVLYPGNFVQGASLPSGIPSPIVAPRGGGELAISSFSGDSATSRLDTVSLATVHDAIRTLVHDQRQRFPADLQIEIRRVRTREELQLELRASGSYFPVFEASAQFHLQDRAEVAAFLVSLKQRHFSIGYELPRAPKEWFSPSVRLEDVAPYIGPGNPPCYVSAVDYGRVFYLLVQSTDRAERIEVTLQANFQYGVVGAEADGAVRTLQELRDLSIEAYAYGGNPQEVYEAVRAGLGAWLQFKSSHEGSTDGHLALPIGYRVRSLRDQSVVFNDIAADYTYEVRSPLDARIPELQSPAIGATGLDNGCGFDPNPVEWDFRWSETPNTDLYEIRIEGSGPGFPLTRQVSTPSCQIRVVGAMPTSGWSWKVRARSAGVWQPFSSTRSFGLEPLNSDCRTGVEIFTHPDYGGGSKFVPAGSENTDVDLERLARTAFDNWDDEIDSLRLYNCHVILFEDPLRPPWNGGIWGRFTSSSPNVGNSLFAVNRASAIRILVRPGG